jgi:hypothetical protein
MKSISIYVPDVHSSSSGCVRMTASSSTSEDKKTWLGQTEDGVKKYEILNLPPDDRKAFWEKKAGELRILDEIITGRRPEIKRVEVVVYDEDGKQSKIVELTSPRDLPFTSSTKDISKFRPNPKREKLGELDFRDNVSLKMICYHPKPLNEIPSFRRSSDRIMLAVDGGAHRIQLYLPFGKANELLRMLRRGIYRLKQAPIAPRFANVVRSTTIHAGEDDAEEARNPT